MNKAPRFAPAPTPDKTPVTDHSPGPWYVVGGTEVRGGSRIICETSPHTGYLADGTAENDARLIALAPELLQLAKIVVAPHAPGAQAMAKRLIERWENR